MSPYQRALWQIHFCVLLWGFTAILGKLISLAALPLVWWRMLLVTLVMLCVPRVWRALRALPPQLIAIYAGIGVLVALHWVTFYGAIKLANASVAATCIALAPVFVALIEPFTSGRRFSLAELMSGLIAVIGVAILIGGIPEAMQLGVWVGVASAALVGVFSVLNKRYVYRADALSVTTIELGAGALFLSFLLPFFAAGGDIVPWPDARDGLLLLILAIGCTALPFALSLVALRQISAFTAQMAVNLEPVYAILLAALILGEQHELNLRFYLGVLIVLGAVFVQPLFSRFSTPR